MTAGARDDPGLRPLADRLMRAGAALAIVLSAGDGRHQPGSIVERDCRARPTADRGRRRRLLRQRHARRRRRRRAGSRQRRRNRSRVRGWRRHRRHRIRRDGRSVWLEGAPRIDGQCAPAADRPQDQSRRRDRGGAAERVQSDRDRPARRPIAVRDRFDRPARRRSSAAKVRGWPRRSSMPPTNVSASRWRRRWSRSTRR